MCCIKNLLKYAILLIIESKYRKVVLLTRCQVALVGNLNPFPQNGWGVQSGNEDESSILCLVLHHCLASPHPYKQNYTTLDLSTLIHHDTWVYSRRKVKTKTIAFKNPTCILYKGEKHLKDESTGSFAVLLWKAKGEHRVCLKEPLCPWSSLSAWSRS